MARRGERKQRVRTARPVLEEPQEFDRVGVRVMERVWLTEQQVREAENLTPDSRLQVLELFPWLRERHDLITQRP